MARRFGWPWGEAHYMPGRLQAPAMQKKPGRVFVCSMSDLGHTTVKPEWRRAIVEAMQAAPWHTYIVLTKRPWALTEGLPSSTWVGVTVETQEQAEQRLPLLMQIKAAVRFVSVEPMLGPVTFKRVKLPTGSYENLYQTAVNERYRDIIGVLNGIDWVIAGPETGPQARECDARWIEKLAAEAPVFFDKRKKDWIRREFPVGKGVGE
jgi:protein gp37